MTDTKPNRKFDTTVTALFLDRKGNYGQKNRTEVQVTEIKKAISELKDGDSLILRKGKKNIAGREGSNKPEDFPYYLEITNYAEMKARIEAENKARDLETTGL